MLSINWQTNIDDNSGTQIVSITQYSQLCISLCKHPHDVCVEELLKSMNELLNRLDKIIQLSYVTPTSVRELNKLTEECRNIMRSYAFLSDRAELHQLINDMSEDLAVQSEPEFVSLKYQLIHRIKKFWATFKQIEPV
jgi:hypothetical protein